MRLSWKSVVIPLVVIGVGATGVLQSKSERSCNDLVDASNAVIDQANKASSEAELTALLPKMQSGATEIRGMASDFDAPFSTDANDVAAALDAIAGAISKQDGAAYDSAIDRFNVVIDRTNADCDKAS